jgi:hypothetical protein
MVVVVFTPFPTFPKGEGDLRRFPVEARIIRNITNPGF